MNNNLSNNVSYDEFVAEFNSNRELKYRIVEVSRHVRVKDTNKNDGSLAWVDKVQYIGQRLVPSGWFSRKWETINFCDEYGEQTYFDNPRDIIDWFKCLDGEKCKVIKLYGSETK